MHQISAMCDRVRTTFHEAKAVKARAKNRQVVRALLICRASKTLLSYRCYSLYEWLYNNSKHTQKSLFSRVYFNGSFIVQLIIENPLGNDSAPCHAAPPRHLNNIINNLIHSTTSFQQPRNPQCSYTPMAQPKHRPSHCPRSCHQSYTQWTCER